MPTIAERNLLSDQILAPVGNGAGQLLNIEITGFLSMKGDNYNCELMVVGRSVNGWTTGP